MGRRHNPFRNQVYFAGGNFLQNEVTYERVTIPLEIRSILPNILLQGYDSAGERHNPFRNQVYFANPDLTEQGFPHGVTIPLESRSILPWWEEFYAALQAAGSQSL